MRIILGLIKNIIVFLKTEIIDIYMRVAILADPIDAQKAGIHYYTKELISHLGIINSDIEYIYISQNQHQKI